MREKPILFSTSMVRAILAGRKSMSRRIVKLQPPEIATIKMFGEIPTPFYCADGHQTAIKPKYKVGDILWVRETWAKISDWTMVDADVGLPDGIIYKADWDDTGEHPKWRPSIFMPKEAARILLRVTAVRCERLNEITVDDCRLEGCCSSDCPQTGEHSGECKCDSRFYNVWNDISAKRGYPWKSNPWVWVISFEQAERRDA